MRLFELVFWRIEAKHRHCNVGQKTADYLSKKIGRHFEMFPVNLDEIDDAINSCIA